MYIKIALRHLWRQGVFSAIHVGGLVVGLLAVLFILQYTGFERSYDSFHSNKDRLYRVAFSRHEDGAVAQESARNFAGISDWARQSFPEVEAATRFWTIPANAGFLIQHEGKLYHETGKIIVADSTFFTVFPSLLLRGNGARVLQNASSLVLSERMARKIFGDEDPLGKVIAATEHHEAYQITGILRDMPGNSHMDVDFVRLFNYDWDKGVDLWEGPWRFTYLTLRDQADAVAFESKLNRTLATLHTEHPNTKGVTLSLQAVTDIHLRSHYPDEMKANGQENLVTTLLWIALVILLLVWVNYISIETSRFTVRAREVGIRRIVGSSRWSLSVQFVTEYLCICVAAVGLAALMFPYLLPWFSHYSGMERDGYTLSLVNIGLGAMAVFVLGSLVAGVYPALLLSRLNPVTVLKGAVAGGKRRLQKGIMVFQFTASLVLTGFVFVIYYQLVFMQQANTGMDLDRVLAIRNPTVYSSQEQSRDGAGSYDNFNALRNKLLTQPGVKLVASSSAVPGTEIGFTYTNLAKRHATDPYDPTRYKLLFVDYNFIPAFGIPLKAGRNYNQQYSDDVAHNTIIVNEQAVYALGFNSVDEALNATISFMPDEEWNQYTIVGVTANYHHEAVKEATFPTIFYLNNNHGQQVYYTVKLEAGTDMPAAVAAVEREWKTVFPEKPFDYFFVDAYYDQQFRSELYFGRVFGMFAAVALCICCLGILGMALFEANQRVREISIRKVLGASVVGLTALLTRGYMRLILPAMVLAAPLIYYAATAWLEQYPVRTGMRVWFYVGPLVIVMVITGLTAGWQIVRAARSNPVEGLRESV